MGGQADRRTGGQADRVVSETQGGAWKGADGATGEITVCALADMRAGAGGTGTDDKELAQSGRTV